MKKLNFNVLPVFLSWVLGHILLHIYLNYLIPYVNINLFIMVLWICFVFYSHYKWAYFMGNNIKRIYVGMYGDDDHS